MTTKATTTNKRALVRLTVTCNDDLRFFEIPLRGRLPPFTAGFQSAITEAAGAFAQTLMDELQSQRHSPVKRELESQKSH
jgi:hypothetical protein